MPNSKLPQRDPFVGPPGTYNGAPGDVVELFADAIRQWAHQPATEQQPHEGARHGAQ
ncbi:hypothetical protein [Nocardia sp. NPDC004604]|uniref:hypothetical protein n=1 Tax=Nocardia sp. NPDC004604 TaxID=3157013 RepID=UPI0033A11C6C